MNTTNSREARLSRARAQLTGAIPRFGIGAARYKSEAIDSRLGPPSQVFPRVLVCGHTYNDLRLQRRGRPRMRAGDRTVSDKRFSICGVADLEMRGGHS